jgi:hypothetical protein
MNLDLTTLIGQLQAGWPTPANLTALQGDANVGDGKGYQADGSAGTAQKPGVAFATGQFVTLGDNSKAHFTGTAWAAGAA